MSAPVAEKSPVATKPKHHVFLSRRSNLRLIMEKGFEKKDPQGLVYETVQGKRVAFEDGRLIVPVSGEVRGEKGEVLDAAEVLEFLMGNPEKGKLPHQHFGNKEEGFWLHEEPAPQPSADEHNRLGELAMDLDVEGIEAFIAQEEEGWAREELLTLARAQLERVKEKSTELEERVERARQEGADAAKGAGGAGEPRG